MRVASVPWWESALRHAARHALSLSLLAIACVSTPRPAGPVSLEGVVPAPGSPQPGRASPVPRATQGPLLLRDARLGREGGAYLWSVVVANPSDTTFEATVVATLLDETGAPLAYASRELELGAGDEGTVQGELPAAGEPVRFRIEYWVRLPPPPERRIERIGD